MNHDHHSNDSHDSQPPSFWRSRYAIGLAVLGAIAAYFLLTEHLAQYETIKRFALLDHDFSFEGGDLTYPTHPTQRAEGPT